MTMHADAQRRPATGEKIPKVLVRAMCALVLAVLVIVSYARLADVPISATPPAGTVVAERFLFLETRDLSGAVMVLDANGAVIGNLTPEEGGFIAGVARVIERERLKARAAPDGPVQLKRLSTGRLSITDPSTGWSADLMGFGADNARAFARLLDN